MSAKLVVPAEVFSRISGYFRPVQQWNRGKREEFKNRKMVSPGLVAFDRGNDVSVCCKERELIS
jgi:hypothetical protein